MMAKEIGCELVAEKNLAGLYLAGKLAGSDAEAFEAHYISCERCWNEVQRGAEIRSAMSVPTVVRASSQRSRPDVWTPLAAAAVVAVLAIGLARFPQPSDSSAQSADRGTTAEAFDLRASLVEPQEVVLEWRGIPQADTYVVKIFGSDGTPIMSNHTAGLRVSLDVRMLPPLKPGVSVLAAVQALDATGLAIARSEAVGLPID